MSTLTIDSTRSTAGTRPRAPIWLLVVAVIGVVWNLYGLYQFVGSFTQTTETLMAAGMTEAQATLYLGLPAWITVAFAVGVLGGVLGSVALLLQRRWASAVFAASLAGYVLLFAGDLYYGVFAAIPAQLVILAVVVVVAFALSCVSSEAGRRGLLR